MSEGKAYIATVGGTPSDIVWSAVLLRKMTAVSTEERDHDCKLLGAVDIVLTLLNLYRNININICRYIYLKRL